MKSETSGESYIVRCRGLPWSAKTDEIAGFFDNCELADDKERSIVITNNNEGRPSGEAFVVLATEEDLNEALKKDREEMGGRYIEVFKAKYDEMEWATNRKSTKNSKDNVLRLRGLPYNSTSGDIMTFFDGITINPSCVMITSDQQGRSSGEAFVQFNSKECVEKAMKKNKQNMGGRYIEIFPSGMTDAFNSQSQALFGGQGTRGRTGPYDRPSPTYGRGFGRNLKGVAGREGFNNTGRGGMRRAGGKVGHLVRMRGIPFSATEMDIAEWFSSAANPIDVDIEYNDDGRPSGDADAYFRTGEDAKNAMSKNKQNMQRRYVELFNEGPVGAVAPEAIPYGMMRGLMGMSGNNGINQMTSGMGLGGGMGYGLGGGIGMGMGIQGDGGMTNGIGMGQGGFGMGSSGMNALQFSL